MGPSGRERLPPPSTRRVAPSSMPGGMVTEMVRCAARRPAPRHVPHGWLTSLPVPWQRELLEALAKELGDEVQPQQKTFVQKLKEFFG